MAVSRSKLRYRVVVALVLFGVGISACQSVASNDVESIEDIADPNSPLLDILVRKDDFSEGWRWLDSRILEASLLPTEQNYYLIDDAGHALTGLYSTSNHYVIIMHGLQLYKESVPDITYDDTDLDVPNGQTIILDTGPIQSEMSICIRESAQADTLVSVICRVRVKYASIVSTLTVYAPTSIDTETLETIIIPVLTKIDSRINEMNR